MHDEQHDLLQDLLWQVGPAQAEAPLESKGSGGQRAHADRRRQLHVPPPQAWYTRIGNRCHTAIMFLWILCFVTILMTAAALVSHWFWRGVS